MRSRSRRPPASEIRKSRRPSPRWRGRTFSDPAPGTSCAGAAVIVRRRMPTRLGTNMSERFSEILRAASEPAWSDAVRHRFVNELFAGAVPDAVMARYLIQDHRFLDSFLTLLGATLASADTFEARVRFGRFIGMVSGEENTRLSTLESHSWLTSVDVWAGPRS